MLSYLNYGLSDYQDFRTLEFHHARLRDENVQLKAKLRRIQGLYDQLLHENVDLYGQRAQLIERAQNTSWTLEKNLQSKELQTPKKALETTERQAMSQEKQQKQPEIPKTLIQPEIPKELIQQFERALTKLSKGKLVFASAEFKGLVNSQEEEQCHEQQLHEFMINIPNLLLKFDRKVQQLEVKLHETSSLAHQLEEEKELKMDKLIIDISDLERDIGKLESLRVEMAAENIYLKEQNEVLMMKLNSFQQLRRDNPPVTTVYTQEDHQNPNEQGSIEDNNFAVEFLNFEKELLRRIFTRVISCFRESQLSGQFKEVYDAYQEVVESYKEKLQLEYDLYDLEFSYKREKKLQTKGLGSLLVEMRKKIQVFRRQLQKQNQIFYQHENTLQAKLKDLQAEEAHQTKLRHYTIEIQKKLNRTIVSNENKPDNEIVRISDRSSFTQKPDQIKTILNLRQTPDSDQFMKEVIRKDRENLERILKETREKHLRRDELYE